MDNKDKIKIVYKELIGYLEEAPEEKNSSELISNKALWTRPNEAIDELNGITEGDYNRFKLTPINTGYSELVSVADLRAALGGITNRLHAEFFSEEDGPKNVAAGIHVIQSQNQQQHQELYLQTVVELATTATQKLQDTSLSDAEARFLEGIKSGLSKAKSGMELILLILNTASALGLSASQIINLLK